MRNNQKGFTLIELLVVIAIIGLLSTLAVVALNSAREKSRDSKRVADIKQVQTALELFFSDSSTGYPANPASNAKLGTAGGGRLCDQGWVASTVTCTNTTYMGLVPKAPTPEDGVCTSSTNPYTYTQTGSGSGYTIDFCLGGTVGDLASGVRQASQDGMQ
jgi:general secretion pathway protein G